MKNLPTVRELRIVASKLEAEGAEWYYEGGDVFTSTKSMQNGCEKIAAENNCRTFSTFAEEHFDLYFNTHPEFPYKIKAR